MFLNCFSHYSVPIWKTYLFKKFQYRKAFYLLSNIFHFGPENRVEQLKSILKKKLNLKESPLPPSQLVVRPSQSLIRSPFGVFRLSYFESWGDILVLVMYVVIIWSLCDVLAINNACILCRKMSKLNAI